MAPRRQIHDRIGAPADGPNHLFDFFLDRRDDCRVADVGVDLHQEIPADDHRLELRVIDVAGNDRPSRRHFLPHEFRRDLFRDAGTKSVTWMLTENRSVASHALLEQLAPLILANRGVLHLRGHDPLTGVVHLGDASANGNQ